MPEYALPGRFDYIKCQLLIALEYANMLDNGLSKT